MVYMSMVFIRAMARRQACTKSQLTHLLHQIQPRVCQAILEDEAHKQICTVAAIKERLTLVDSYIDVFKR